MKIGASMGVKAANYLSHRRSLGYALEVESSALRDFGRYADRIGHHGPLTLALALQWARLPTKADPTYWARRLGIVRGLAKYLLIEDPETEVPPIRILGPARRRRAPHIYSAEEITQLLAKSQRLSPGKGLHPLTPRASICAKVKPSTPGAPPLVRQHRQACHSTSSR